MRKKAGKKCLATLKVRFFHVSPTKCWHLFLADQRLFENNFISASLTCVYLPVEDITTEAQHWDFRLTFCQPEPRVEFGKVPICVAFINRCPISRLLQFTHTTHFINILAWIMKNKKKTFKNLQ